MASGDVKAKAGFKVDEAVRVDEDVKVKGDVSVEEVSELIEDLNLDEAIDAHGPINADQHIKTSELTKNNEGAQTNASTPTNADVLTGADVATDTDIPQNADIDTKDVLKALEDIKVRVDAAIKRFCDDLDAIYTNLFDQSTLQNLDTETRLRKRVVVCGSYPLGTWQPGEDIHILCLGNNTAEIFWPYLKEKLHLHQHTTVPRARDTGAIELSSPVFSRVVDKSRCCLPTFVALRRRNEAACRFYLHYIEVPMSVAVDTIATSKIPYHTGRRADLPACKNVLHINACLAFSLDRDLQSTSKLSDFTQLLNILRCWAKSHGLIGRRLGFLGANAFMWLAGQTIKDGRAKSLDETDMEELLKIAFENLKNYLDDNAEPTLLCTQFQGLMERLHLHAKQAYALAISRTMEGSLEDTVLCKKQTQPFQDFLDDFDLFFVVDCNSWHDIIEDRDEFQNITVRKCMLAIVSFLRNDDSSHAGKFSTRIWPSAVVATSTEREQRYVIGVKLQHPHTKETFMDEAAEILEEVQKLPLEYDHLHNNIWITLATKGDLSSNAGDGFESLGECYLGDESSCGDPPRPLRQLDSSTFRTASAAISRLLFDPRYRVQEFEVGYVDRFEPDLQWVSLREWKGREVEDEDFVPQHRVRKLRLASNGVVVWDRDNRFDRL